MYLRSFMRTGKPAPEEEEKVMVLTPDEIRQAELRKIKEQQRFRLVREQKAKAQRLAELSKVCTGFRE